MSAGDGRRQQWVEWISVKDQLPPCASTVLVYAGEKRLRGFYLPQGCQYAPLRSYAGWYEDIEHSGRQPRIKTEVTHWMELPAGPETQA